LLTKADKLWENSFFSYNIFVSADFRSLLSKICGRKGAKFTWPIVFLFGRFSVILLNFRPAGNSVYEQVRNAANVSVHSLSSSASSVEASVTWMPTRELFAVPRLELWLLLPSS
jgi:hypothetical protein